MSSQPNAIQSLVEEFKKLPGIGQKGAERLAFHLVRGETDTSRRLAQAILNLKEKICVCSVCCAIAEFDPCEICSDPERDKGIICVVEEPQDLYAIERTGAFNGVFHVLMGAIAPLEGIGPESLKISELIKRVQQDPPKEIILATNPNMEGEATAVYIVRKLKSNGLKVTRLARGLPMGGNLEYADEVTLAKSFQGRTNIENNF